MAQAYRATGAAPAAIEAAPPQLSTRQIIPIMASIMLGMLLASIDQTIVGTAMPRIIAQLNGLEHYAWVATAYLLASTVTVPIYGKLSDIYGRKPLFIVGMVIFLLGSALSGASQTMTQLIFFRAIQGIGAGSLMPIALSIIGDILAPAERGKWQGMLVAVFGLSSIIGPTAGGWITDNWGWRWTFYVNMPIGAIALIVAIVVLPVIGQRRQHTIDYLGAATLVAGAVSLLLAFSWAGTQYPWASVQIVGLLIAAVVLLAVFIFIEMRVVEPIITPALFKNSIFSISVLCMFLLTAGMFGAVMFLPLFVQGVLGNSATNSGVVLTPMMFGFMFSSIVGGQILSRTGRYKILALFGFAVATVGMYLLSRMDATSSDGLVVRNMIIVGLGIGVLMSLFTIVVQNAFPIRQLGEVTSAVTFFRSIGATIGIAIFGSVMTNQFQSALQRNMPAALDRIPKGQLASLQNPQVLLAPGVTAQIQHRFAAFGPQGQLLFGQLIHAIRVSLAGAITELFLMGAGALALAFVATWFLREIPLRKGTAPSPAERAAEGALPSSNVEQVGAV